MRKTTDGKKLRGAVISALVMGGLLLAFAVSMIAACFAGTEGAAEVVILVLTALVFLAMVVGIFIALAQRRREIEGGEEDEAKNIEEQRAKRKREALRGVVIFALIQVVTAGLIGWVCFLPDVPRWCAIVCGVIAVGSLLLILPAVIVLKARFREIEGGELDAAAEY